MKFDTSGINPTAFAKRLGNAYGISFVSITFSPKGEESFCYVAQDAAGHVSFIRAQECMPNNDLEAVYVAVAALHDRCGLTEALAPFATMNGACAWQYARFTVARFPFVSGTSIYESGVTGAKSSQAARIMAHLHACDPRRLPALPREAFANPFQPVIERALAASASLPATATVPQRRLRALLLEQQSDIEATLEHLRELHDGAHRLNPSTVPTHGDPNFANFLIDETGQLHLTDWGEIALGPRERDLTHFTGEHFASFLETYLAATGPICLHHLLFRFYAYRWVVQEIADYTARILFDPPDPASADHAWTELQPYLPIPHADIESGLQAINTVLQQFAASGTIDSEG